MRKVMLLNDYMTAALRTMPRHSVTAICKELEIATATWYRWRNWHETRRFPDAHHIVMIADIAQLPVPPLLFGILAEQEQEPRVKKVYSELVA